MRLEAILEEVNPEYIFHLAAQPIVKTSFEYPNLTFETNTIGTLNLVDLARRCKDLETVVVITTDKVYENAEPYYYSENDKLGGDDPYSASKACAEIVVNSFKADYQERGISLCTARAGNVVGGGDWQYRLIPMFIDSWIKDSSLTIWNPNAVRPWQFVLDCLYGYLLLGAEHRTGSWNFGPDEENWVSVSRILKSFIKFAQAKNYCVGSGKYRESERVTLNPSKAFKELGWKTRYDINQIAEKTVNWYATYYYEPNYLLDLTYKQIDEYQNQKL